MSLILRQLLRDPLVTRPLSRALRRRDPEMWLEEWPTRGRRVPGYDSPAMIWDDMNRQMDAAIERMQEFAEDLEAMDALTSRFDREARTRGQKRRRDDTIVKRTESGGLQLSLDVEDFKPETLKIKLVDDNLVVEATTESSGKDSYCKNHFKRWFKLPDDCKVDEIRSKLTEDNKLLIDLPLNKPIEQKTRTIPIEMSKPAESQASANPEGTTDNSK